MKKVALTQSSYIPWKGYFDLINMVDEFIIFDSVQYVKRSWRNRNYIKGSEGRLLLSIPVHFKHQQRQNIYDIVVADDRWRQKHWKSISINYNKSRFFQAFREPFETLYLGERTSSISQINYQFIRAICHMLDIKTKITFDTEYHYKHETGNIETIIALLQHADTDIFINGPTAQQYMSKEIFADHNIELQWMEYGNYPQYMQLHPPFEHHVSILDLIFNEGPAAKNFMLSFEMNPRHI